MKVAVIQLTSTQDYQQNLNKIQSFLTQIKESDSEVKAIFLPEVYYSMSDSLEVTPHLVEERNEHFQNIQSLALKSGFYILGGSVATQENDLIFNRNFNFDPEGNVVGTYDKINLFQLNLKGMEKSTVISEAEKYTSGKDLCLVELDEWKVGISICFDLRFPEIYREYFLQGANILSVSSAFTIPTGKAHWETLLRARAIENQSYVIASGQWGQNNKRVSTYGHSLVIDPWGEVILNLNDGETFGIVELSLERVKKIRERMNISPKR